MDFSTLFNPVHDVPLKFSKRNCLDNKINTYETRTGKCASPNMYHVFNKLFSIEDKKNRAEMYTAWKNDLLWRCNGDGEAVHAELTFLIRKYNLNAHSRQSGHQVHNGADNSQPPAKTSSVNNRSGDLGHLRKALQALLKEAEIQRYPVTAV